VSNLRRIRKVSFAELVTENKRLLLNDKEAINKIEERVENKRLSKV
jgi:hypothetical protein